MLVEAGPAWLTNWDRRINVRGHWALDDTMPRLIRSAVSAITLRSPAQSASIRYRMITEFHLPAACLTDSEIKISAGEVGRLFEAAAGRSGKIDFGLRLADRRTLSNLGALALLVREQPTIRKALEVLVGYMFLHSESLVIRLQEQNGLVVLGLAIEVDRPVPIRQCYPARYWVSAPQLSAVISRALETGSCLFHSCSASEERRLSQVLRYRGQVQSGLQRHHLRVGRSRCARAGGRFQDGPPCQQYLDTLAARRDITMSATVRECIYTMLPSGLCSADSVAARLGVDRRTVHRHLAREGTTFSALIDSVRAELVTRYVENRDRPLASLAELLGFSALSAFSRWFRTKFGCSVSEWRAGAAASKPTETAHSR